ncbi:kinase-like domain-containing protein [Dunaliella salina]|uniref:Kinase-like domain-containing protein n=1 Tax=Dunaliella salina TaxID=3046 RepID=A0ABQ7H9B3_DUNSA|nr:kinase-like domain-containing protein [Dunaliella salina]|eukprot:KAF5843445.1 kinase-like domain-containing protein [Dunaliella salina]
MISQDAFGPRYQVLEVIGKGSYGTVYKALDNEDGQLVAIKHIKGMFQGASTKAAADAQRVLREIKLLRLLRESQDVVQLKSIIAPDSRDFQDIALVFELMEADLHMVIKLNTDLQPDHHRWFLFQMLRCLNYMHHANVLHRDLKPQNILVNADCTLKICDLGLARTASTEKSNDFWTDYVATRWYRAPELCGSFSATYTPQVDIWSAGCIFAEMLLRRPLFMGRDVIHQLQLITDILGTPRLKSIAKVHNPKARAFLAAMPKHSGISLQRVLHKAEPDAVDLVHRMLAFDPGDRITAAEALRHPYFNSLRDMVANQFPFPKITGQEFAYEKANMQVEDIKELMWLETLEYHPQLQKAQEARSLLASFVRSSCDLQSLQCASRESSCPSPPSVEILCPGSSAVHMRRAITFCSETGLPWDGEHLSKAEFSNWFEQCLWLDVFVIEIGHLTVKCLVLQTEDAGVHVRIKAIAFCGDNENNELFDALEEGEVQCISPADEAHFFVRCKDVKQTTADVLRSKHTHTHTLMLTYSLVGSLPLNANNSTSRPDHHDPSVREPGALEERAPWASKLAPNHSPCAIKSASLDPSVAVQNALPGVDRTSNQCLNKERSILLGIRKALRETQLRIRKRKSDGRILASEVSVGDRKSIRTLVIPVRFDFVRVVPHNQKWLQPQTCSGKASYLLVRSTKAGGVPGGKNGNLGFATKSPLFILNHGGVIEHSSAITTPKENASEALVVRPFKTT